MVLTQKEGLSILDFGGGMGIQYLETISKVPNSKNKIDYYVIDGKASIDNCPIELHQFTKLNFFSSLDNVNLEMDIIHIGSTLQYIEDWQNLLITLNQKYKPKYFVLSDLLAGTIPTFVSHQIFYDKKIPHIFFNIKEFENFMLYELKFNMLFKAKLIRNILGQEEILPNFALPSTHRIDRSLNLVFTTNK